MRLNIRFESLVFPVENCNEGVPVAHQANDAESVGRCGLAHTMAARFISFGQRLPPFTLRRSIIVLRSNEMVPLILLFIAVQVGLRDRTWICRSVDGPEEDQESVS